MTLTPPSRIRSLNDQAVRAEGDYVLYWVTASRRMAFNFALQRAVERANELQLPLVIFEALRVDYPWASARLHQFVLQGMRDNQQACAESAATYLPWVEPHPGAGSGLLEQLASRAAVIVCDDYPCFFLPKMAAAVGRRVPVLLEAVDAGGLLPMRQATQTFPTAYAFRRFLQQQLKPHLEEFPEQDPLGCLLQQPRPSLPDLSRWPSALTDFSRIAESVSRLPVDQSVPAVHESGGHQAAQQQLRQFISRGLHRYADERSDPDACASSNLSPWLHFGHLSAHEVLREIIRCEDWCTSQLGEYADVRGSKSGWWGMSPSAEAFLDELVTWRELGFNLCSRESNYDHYDSLPAWARETLQQHASDPRPVIYEPGELEAAKTRDELWNAAQRQLTEEGRIHNYLRMLWGKKILEWTPSPQDALQVMIELNNRWALDGRDPNSYSGIFWVLGRYDRPWGPERPIFGKVRYMTSDNTRRKLKLKGYLMQYGAAAQ